MKLRRRRPGARYYRGKEVDSPAPTGYLKLQNWASSQQNQKPLGRGERLSLALVLIGSLVAVLLPFWPEAPWPEIAILSGGGALLGILGIVAFFVTYLRTHTS